MLTKLVCLSVLIAIVSAEHKIPVSVYYEALCPDSIKFVTNQIVPAYNSGLKNYMDLQLVPYGKASHHKSPESHQWEFRCHHGPVECYGNKVQGCILKQIPNDDDKIKYIDCLLKQAKKIKNEYPLGGCISGGDLAIVTKCANGTHVQPNGSDILAENGDITARLNPPLTSVPTVVFNHVFNKTDQDRAESHFKKVLCSYLKEECPPECSSSSAASTSTSIPILAVAFLAVFRLL